MQHNQLMDSLLVPSKRNRGYTAVPLSAATVTDLNTDLSANANKPASVPAGRHGFHSAPHYASPTPDAMIDNSRLVYIPMHLTTSGVTVYCRPDVLASCPSILRDLHQDVLQCLAVLPKSLHSLIKRTKIWVNTTYHYGPTNAPKNVNHSTAHHHQSWLEWARDLPEKAPGIEIYNCFDYQEMKWHWNGCGLLLHEYCHLIHQFSLTLDHPLILKEYRVAKQSGRYEDALRRDWAGLEEDSDMAYGMVNPKEFFAELSVAYWSTSYTDLALDGKEMAKASPPFMAPNVVERLDPDMYSIGQQHRRQSSWFRHKTQSTEPAHCNKFYPFTRSQFQKMDPQLFQVFDDLWSEIEAWQDEDEWRRCCCWPCC